MTQQQQHAPSAERRKRLKEREAREGKKLMKVSDSFPIEKYYGMSERLLQAFHQAVDERRLDDAYVFGLRFATFGIESLPKHSQYNHPHFKRQKGKNARHVDQVLKKLESVAARMDAEELRLARQRKEAALAKQREAEARQQQAQQQEQERLQREATKKQRHQDVLQKQRAELKAHQKQQAKQELEQSALSKLKRLNQQTAQSTPAAQPKQQRQPSNTGTTLISANTGQAPTTMEAIAKQKAQEAARLKEEQEKREASAAAQAEKEAPGPQKKATKKKTKRTSKTKAPEATKAAPPKTVKQPSKLDPNALAQVNQLQKEIAKQQQEEKAAASASTTAIDYKSEFAKHQAEWKNKQEKSQKKDGPDAKKKKKKKKEDAPSSDSCSSSTDSKKKKKKQDAPSSTSCSVPPPPAKAKKRPSSKKQASNAKIQAPAQDPPATTKVSIPQKPAPAKQASQTKIQQPKPHEPAPQQPRPAPKNEGYSVPQPAQAPPPAMVVSAGRKDSPPKRSSMMAGAKAGAKSTLKLLTSLSPKRNKQIGPNNEAPPQDEGFELKLTDAGPAVVDDFSSYHDEAYRAKLTPSEAKTIQMLEKAIHLQENRLQVLESSPERQSLRAEAKKRLKGGDRKGALYCLARKKRINQTIEVVKQAIFNMETQIIMLESAVENREVNKIMKEASDAMAAQGNGVRVNDFTDERLGDVLATVGQGDMEYDEEELLSELHDRDQPVGNADDVDDIDGLLSLPSAPVEPCPIPDVLPKKESDAVSKIIASLF